MKSFIIKFIKAILITHPSNHQTAISENEE